jgi:hypothetical protein
MYPSNYYYVDWATGTGIPASSNVPSAALVGAGDTISADVKLLSTSGKVSTFQLSITDTPAGGGQARTFSITQTIKSAARSSAEWVLEQTGTLSNFSTETFTNAQATINGATATIGSFLQGDSSTVVYKMDIVDRHGVSLDRTSELNSSGDGFTVYYGPTLPASAGGGGARGPRELLDDLPVVVPAQVATAGAGSNPTVVAISPATPTSPVLASGAIVQPGFRLTFSQPEGTAGRAGVVVAGLARGEGTLGAGSSWLAPPSGPGAAVPLPVAPGAVSTLPEGVRVRSSAEPFASWSPVEQSALASASAQASSEEVHVDQLAAALPLLAFLPHVHVPWAKGEPAQARRRLDGNGRPE